MKRRNLCNTKKLLAVILAASMCMNSGMVTLADIDKNIQVSEGETKKDIQEASISSQDNTDIVVDAPYTTSTSGNKHTEVEITDKVYTEDGNRDSVTGVDADSQGSGSTTTVSVGNEVDVSSTGTGVGVNANSSDSGKTSVEVGRDVEITTGNTAEGVKASSNKDSYTSVSVGHEVEVESGNKATGIEANSVSRGTTEVNVGKSGSEGSGVTVKSNGESATGVEVSSHGNAKSDVKVEGTIDVTSNADASGIVIERVTEGGNVSVSSGDVVVKSGSTGKGIELGCGDENFSSGIGTVNGSATVNTGSISVTTESSGEWPLAVGIRGGVGEEGSVDITVNGDILATNGSGDTEGIQTEGVKGELTIHVIGSVEQNGAKGFAIGLNDAGEDSSKTDINITVINDVTAYNNDAVQISKMDDDSKLSLEVDGTISGKDHNIVLMGESTTEKLDITVWKVDTSNDKHVVDTYDYNNGYSKVDVGDSIVNYIIKADSTEAKIAMSGQGEQRSDGTYVAKEGKEVYFSVDIPNGYTAEFYDVNDNTAYQIIPNGTGGAYISVPRGGGVYVGVRLTKTSTAESNSDSTKESSSANTVTIVNSESRSESGASDGEYWSPSTSSNNQANALGGVFSGYETLQALTIPSAIYGGPDMFVNVADVLTPVDTITAMNSFTGTDRASINTNNVMGAGIVDFKNMFVNASSNTVEVPVPANVVANQSYTVMFSDGTSIVVPCAMNGVLSIPFSKTADGLTYIICGIQLDPSMFIGMPPATGWTY